MKGADREFPEPFLHLQCCNPPKDHVKEWRIS